MPYSITTKDGITIQNIPDDIAPDSQVLKDRVAATRSAQLQGQPEAPRVGVVEGIKEAVTGEKRRTAETEKLPDWASMPELNSFSMASAKTALGTLLASPDETVKIIKAQYPGVQVNQDEKGNYLLKSSINGKDYVIKPGFRTSDVPRAVGGALAFTPAGRAESLLGAGIASAATQAAVEGTQAATGGEFNPAEIATAGALGAAAPAVAQGIKAVAAPARKIIASALGREAPAGGAIPAAGEAAPLPAAVPAPAPTSVAPAAAPAEAVAPMAMEELGQTTRKAALGGLGSKKATKTLAEQVAPDADTVAAADRLGITEYLQPDHVTTNQAYRQLSQLVKSQPGSEAYAAQRSGLEKVAERANAIIDEVGGSPDVSTLSADVRSRMASTQKELLDKADEVYSEIRNKIPATTEAPAKNVLDFLKQRSEDLGGSDNLSSMEKRILRKLTPKEGGGEPTYALLDDVRKEVGAAARAAGPFKDADTGLAKKIYGLLSDDQQLAAEANGAGDLYATAKNVVSVRKGLEDDMASIFGKNLDKSIAPVLSGAIKDLSKGDSSKLAKLVQSVPPEMRQEVVSSGLSSFFQRTVRGGEMDFAGYSKLFDALDRNKQAKAALFSTLPKETTKQLTDLAKVAKGVAMSKGEFIATGKANSKVLDAADGLMNKVYEAVAQRGLSGLAAETIGSSSGMPGFATAIMSATTKNKTSAMQAADKLIASPEFMQAVKTAGTPQANYSIRALSRSKQFMEFSKKLNNPGAMSNRERWIAAAMQQQRATQQKKEIK